jgi:hypothetical protein
VLEGSHCLRFEDRATMAEAIVPKGFSPWIKAFLAHRPTLELSSAPDTLYSYSAFRACR